MESASLITWCILVALWMDAIVGRLRLRSRFADLSPELRHEALAQTWCGTSSARSRYSLGALALALIAGGHLALSLYQDSGFSPGQILAGDRTRLYALSFGVFLLSLASTSFLEGERQTRLETLAREALEEKLTSWMTGLWAVVDFRLNEKLGDGNHPQRLASRRRHRGVPGRAPEELELIQLRLGPDLVVADRITLDLCKESYGLIQDPEHRPSLSLSSLRMRRIPLHRIASVRIERSREPGEGEFTLVEANGDAVQFPVALESGEHFAALLRARIAEADRVRRFSRPEEPTPLIRRAS